MALTQVNSLEFNEIKNQLKAYLRGQAEFSDYDFEGSSLSTLLDVLAYNTCLLYTSPSPRDTDLSRMPSSA